MIRTYAQALAILDEAGDDLYAAQLLAQSACDCRIGDDREFEFRVAVVEVLLPERGFAC